MIDGQTRLFATVTENRCSVGTIKSGVSAGTGTSCDASLASDAGRTLEDNLPSALSAFIRPFTLELIPSCPLMGDEQGRWCAGTSG